MDIARLRAERLHSHRLSAPAPTVAEAAAHMTATQAQEFWGGRWALASRTKGDPVLSDVDAAFDRGELVRSWTQRGTLHIIAPQDLAWMLAVTAERQRRQWAAMHRSLEITDDVVDRAERVVRPALSGGDRLTRAEFGRVLAGAGIDPAGMRGNHVLSALCLRGVTVLGPVVARTDAPSRDQYIVAADEWTAQAAAPADPLAEFLVRYLRGHGPASLDDFRWWAGLPLGLARAAREGAGDRVVEIEEGVLAESARENARDSTGQSPRETDAGGRGAPPAALLALPPFDEYYLSYVDRTVACPPAHTAVVGPSINGIVRPVLVAGGEVVGTWRHSLAVGKHHLDPEPALFAPRAGLDEASVTAALTRFARFLRA